MKKSNIIYNRLTLSLASGKQHISTGITLDEGTCMGVYIIPLKNTNPEHLIEVGVQNAQSSDIITSTDFRDYTHKGGGYFQGVKQLNFPTNNSRFGINVNASQALDDDFMAQMIFIIKLPCGCENGMGNPGCGCQ